MAEIKWTKSQLEVVLESILERLENDKDSFYVDYNSDMNRVKCYNESEDVWFELYKNELILMLERNSGVIAISSFFWSDVKIKHLLHKIKNFHTDLATRESNKLIYKVLPEALNKKFEEDILNGKQEP